MGKLAEDRSEPGPGEGNCRLDLRLYLVNHTPRSVTAYRNIVRICEHHVKKPYRITVIDLQRNPEIARKDGITAIPTLIRIPRKKGARKIIGTLADTRRVIGELGLAPQDGSPAIPGAP